MGHDPFLTALSDQGKELLIKSFLSLYRNASWNVAGGLTGIRVAPVVSSTVRDAASSLAAAFRYNHQLSPFHEQGRSNMLPVVRSLLKAYDNVDPPTNRQKAITPKLLRCMHASTGVDTLELRDTLPAATADLTIGAFFFAKRSCEFSTTRKPGRTKIVTLQYVLFRNRSKQIVPHDAPDLLDRAEYVTIIFVSQKNGKKMDLRTQRRTGDPILCPVLRYGSVVRRLLRQNPLASKDTPLNTVHIGAQIGTITNDYVRNLLRTTCSSFGGKETFGYSSTEIGNKSIRSGAAMSLFLSNVSTARIMLLGRWSSDAFLAYIRPQVLEWTSNMSKSMIKIDSFLDPSSHNVAANDDPRQRKQYKPFNGSNTILMPKLHLHHWTELDQPSKIGLIPHTARSMVTGIHFSGKSLGLYRAKLGNANPVYFLF
jgi:hypothetical protein